MAEVTTDEVPCGTSEASADTSEEPKSSSIAIQANDYEIERGSGVLPARRRIIPFKFRDYHDPTIIIKDDESDDEYSPSEQPEAKKKLRYSKPGRPRKNPADHTYEKGDESVENNMDGSGEDVDPALLVPKRGRPTKNETRGDSDKVYKCQICKKGFSQKGNLKVHQKIHTDERPFKCDHDNCGKAFRANEALKRHKLSHLGIKLFKCDMCEKNFSSNVALKEHVSRHTNDKPHDCPHCDRKFRQISCMRRHVMTHTNIKPYECTLCGMRFSQMIYVRSHMKRHTGEKPFKCTVCDKSFAHHSDLNRHKTVHSGEKPYDCEVCGAKFTDPSSRRRHVKEHFGFKPFQCMLCEDTFKRADQLKSHLSKKHECKLATVPIAAVRDSVTQQQKEVSQGMHVLTDGVGNVFQVVHDKGMIQLLQQEMEVVPEQQVAKEGNYNMEQLIRHLEKGEEVQVIQQASNEVIEASQQVQVLKEMSGGEIQVVQVGEAPRDHSQQVILTPAPGQEDQELLQEQTEQILAQIRSQLQEQATTSDDGVPLQVSYQIIHDDENQQIVEIQYINATAEEEGDSGQGVVHSQDVNVDFEAVVSQNNANSEHDIHAMNSIDSQNEVSLDSQAGPITTVSHVIESIENIQNTLEGAGEAMTQVSHLESDQVTVAEITDNSNDNNTLLDTETEMIDHSQATTIETVDIATIDPVESESNIEDPSVSDIAMADNETQASDRIINSHYIRKPDFNSQEYFNWLSLFTDLCKLVAMPLEVQLFQNISHVHKTLSDVLANPKGILTNRENFRTLMSISTELSSVINEHLSFVLEKLKNEESSEVL